MYNFYLSGDMILGCADRCFFSYHMPTKKHVVPGHRFNHYHTVRWLNMLEIPPSRRTKPANQKRVSTNTANARYLQHGSTPATDLSHTTHTPIVLRLLHCLRLPHGLGRFYAVFKSVTTRHIEVWDVESGEKILAFDSGREENLLRYVPLLQSLQLPRLIVCSVDIKDPGYIVASSASNVYVWDMRAEDVREINSNTLSLSHMSQFPQSPLCCNTASPMSAFAFGDDHFVGGDFNGNMSVIDTISGKAIFDFELQKKVLKRDN